MIIDDMLRFGVLSIASEGNLPNDIDTLKAGDAIGDELYFHVQSYGPDAPAGVTDLTVTVKTADDDQFSQNAEAVITAKVKLVDKKLSYSCRMPLGMRRYLRASITPNPGEGCTGCIVAYLSHAPQHSFADFKA